MKLKLVIYQLASLATTESVKVKTQRALREGYVSIAWEEFTYYAEREKDLEEAAKAAEDLGEAAEDLVVIHACRSLPLHRACVNALRMLPMHI